MKKKYLYLLLVPSIGLLIALLCTVCSLPKDAQMGSTPATPISTTIDRWEMLPPIPLTCWERGEDAPSSQTWRNSAIFGTGINSIGNGGLAADGDLLWISTGRGLVRLNVHTWACDLFTQAAGISLAGSHTLLPDGEGGLWVSGRYGAGENLLFFADGEWQKIGLAWYDISALALNHAGEICVSGMVGKRTPAQVCSQENTFPPKWREIVSPPSESWLDCNLWQRASAWYYRGFHYASPTECELVKKALERESWCMFVSVNDDEVWVVDCEPPDDKDTVLLHQKGKAVEKLSGLFPRRSIDALAADSVRSGVWIGTQNGLVYGEITATADYVFHPFSFVTFEGSGRGLAVDSADQVWVVSGHAVLRYDESKQTWLQVISATHSADAIAADPAGGVWVAGQGQLLHINEQQQQYWPMPDDLRGKPTALLVDEGRRVWMGTSRDGVWTAMPLSQPVGSTPDWHRFTTKDGLVSTLVTALERGPDGSIYAGHHAGISTFDPASEAWITLPDSDIGGDCVWINALAFNRAGDELWVGYYPSATVRRYKGSRWTDYEFPFYSKGEHCPTEGKVSGVHALLIDNKNTLWVGTDDLLYRWSDAGHEKPRGLTFDPQGSNVRGVLSLALDDRGRVWASGTEGVAVWGRE